MRSVVLLERPGAARRLGGLTIRERLVRSLRKLGLEPIGTGPPVHRGMVTTEQLLAHWPDGEEDLVIVPADGVIDERILRAIAEHPALAVVVDSAPPSGSARLVQSVPRTARGRLCGPLRLGRAWLRDHPGDLQEQVMRGVERGDLQVIDVARLSADAPHLRRRFRPFWFPAPAPRDARRARNILLDATQKGALDVPALLHAPIEKFFAWRLAGTPLTPNQITLVTTVVAWLSTWLFLSGRLGWGIGIALCVGVLDGIDGKLARLRLETSKLGEMEHWLDFLYEWSWWAALAFYFSRSGVGPGAWISFGLLALAEILDGAAKLTVLRALGRSIDEASRFDRIIRLLGGRRNVYVWILAVGLAAGRPAAAYGLLPLWEGLTALVHWIRLPWILAGRDATRFGATPSAG
ncbi:MAG: CDP-alcohol phosphatidyltransferase family protein [Acidobacteriota bacterium]